MLIITAPVTKRCYIGAVSLSWQGTNILEEVSGLPSAVTAVPLLSTFYIQGGGEVQEKDDTANRGYKGHSSYELRRATNTR